MNLITLTEEELTRHANLVFVETIAALAQEKLLTAEQADDTILNYSIILESPSWLPSYLAKWLKIDNDKFRWRVVRAVGRKEGGRNAGAQLN